MKILNNENIFFFAILTIPQKIKQSTLFAFVRIAFYFVHKYYCFISFRRCYYCFFIVFYVYAHIMMDFMNVLVVVQCHSLRILSNFYVSAVFTSNAMKLIANRPLIFKRMSSYRNSWSMNKIKSIRIQF